MQNSGEYECGKWGNGPTAGQDRSGASPMPAFFKISHTVDTETETCTPSPARSPWILR
jgi:hypothetical protein